jgi:MoaA/NifB/PqqE/SkfB family radical SAM enzyme
MLPEKICMLPWISIETSPIGTARPCCLAKDEIVDTNGVKYNLNTHTLEEIYHSDYMQDLRQDFLAGNKPSTCQRCWDEEAAGRVSKRMNSRIRLKEYYDSVDWNNLNPDQLWFIDLKLGNICNLKCRICGSWSSSPWAQEEIAYLPGINKKDHLAYKFLKQGAWPRENPQFWDNLKALLPTIKYFEFTGGEPFLIKEHFELLEYAVEHGYAKNIEIHYNTNGTVFPERADLWNEFKQVEIAFSIDNTSARFEYERYLAKWDEVQTNIARFDKLRLEVLQKFKYKKIISQICLTVNIQNVYYLPEICAWIDTQIFDHVYFNMLHDPWYMCISRMTAEAQQLVIDRLTTAEFTPKHKIEIMRIVKFIENGQGSDGKEFIRKIQQTDEYRRQSFLTTHAEIAKAMGYE